MMQLLCHVTGPTIKKTIVSCLIFYSGVYSIKLFDAFTAQFNIIRGLYINANLAIRVTALNVLLVTRCISQTLGGLVAL